MKDLCKQLLVMSESGGQRGVACFFVLVVTLLDERGFPFGPASYGGVWVWGGGVVGLEGGWTPTPTLAPALLSWLTYTH